MAIDMPKSRSQDASHRRLARHRSRVAARGLKRVELALPTGDVAMMKAAARALRTGGADAAKVREALTPVLASPVMESGSDLVAFLRASPLMGADLLFERDRSDGRAIDLDGWASCSTPT